VGLEHDVVDPCADWVDRAGDFGRVDADPVAARERGAQVARLRGGGFRPFLDRDLLRRSVGLRGDALARSGLGIEPAHRQVEAEQQRQAQHDGEDEVALVVQVAILSEITLPANQGTGS
jgi:hypothetical protein